MSESQGATPNQIKKEIVLKAPVARVWNALTDHEQFGAWFRVKLEAPFALGQVARGAITWPGMEHYVWESKVTALEHERLFAFEWHPYAIDLQHDYSKEKPTLVEFRLVAVPEGTRLTLTETGFDQVPDARRSLAYRMNEQGWTVQMKNIEDYVGQKAR